MAMIPYSVQEVNIKQTGTNPHSEQSKRKNKSRLKSFLGSWEPSIQCNLGCQYPLLLQATGAVPLDGLLAGQVSPTDTTKMDILVFDIKLCPSLDAKLHLPGCLTASQVWSAGVFTRCYLIPVCTD